MWLLVNAVLYFWLSLLLFWHIHKVGNKMFCLSFFLWEWNTFWIFQWLSFQFWKWNFIISFDFCYDFKMEILFKCLAFNLTIRYSRDEGLFSYFHYQDYTIYFIDFSNLIPLFENWNIYFSVGYIQFFCTFSNLEYYYG